MLKEDDILDILQQVIDPDLNCSIVDLGLVYQVDIQEKSIHVEYTLTSPLCPIGEQLEQDIVETITRSTDIKHVTAQLVWNPPWSADRMSESLRLSLGLPLDEIDQTVESLHKF